MKSSNGARKSALSVRMQLSCPHGCPSGMGSAMGRETGDPRRSRPLGDEGRPKVPSGPT